MKQIYILLFCWLAVIPVRSQTPSDAFIMPKGDICIAAGIQYESWDHYWEGTLYRNNPNLGTVSTRSINAMAAYGLTKHLNVIGMLPPYIRTRASGGSLAGHSGLQDAALWLKYRPLHRSVGRGRLDAFVSAGGSLPVSNYYPDYLPLSIGLKARTLGVKGMVYYFTCKRLYFGAQGGYTLRSDIRLERDFYYTGGNSLNTNQVDMPPVAEGSVTMGYYHGQLRTEILYTASNTLGGSDIRRNDMPLPSYNMDVQRLNWMMQYRFRFLAGLGLTANAAYTLHGRNMGRSIIGGAGLLYQFNLIKKSPSAGL